MPHSKPSPPTEAASPAGEAVDFDRYIPTVLSRVMLRLRSSANLFFGKQYGISLLEWRILAMLASEGPLSGYTIWNGGALDKAAVTRCLRKLSSRGLVEIRVVPGSKRRKTSVALTAQGRDLHARTFAEVLIRHQRLVSDLSTEEVERFLAIMHKLERSIPSMSDASLQPQSGYRPTKPAKSP